MVDKERKGINKFLCLRVTESEVGKRVKGGGGGVKVTKNEDGGSARSGVEEGRKFREGCTPSFFPEERKNYIKWMWL